MPIGDIANLLRKVLGNSSERVSEVGNKDMAASDPSDGDSFLGKLGKLRYGVSTEDKERLAISGGLPGAPQDNSAGQEKSNRYASGFLFAKQNPTIASLVQPLVNRIKTSDLPFVGGSSPELQSYASQGVSRALSGRN